MGKMRKGKNWWMDDYGYVKFVPMIKDVNLPINMFIDGLLVWLKKPKYKTYEPYSALLRDVFNAGKAGRKAKVDDWLVLLPHVERIVGVINKLGSNFAKAVLNESIAHRYSDCLCQTGDLSYEKKMKGSYLLGHKYARKGNYTKFIDSSLYWLAVAYHRASYVKGLSECRDRFREQSLIYYCKAAARLGNHYTMSKFHTKKLTDAKRKCQSNSIDVGKRF